MNQTAARPPRRRNANAAARKAADRDKCTLLLDADLSRKLSVAASLRGIDRSDLVNEVLRDALGYVVISIRGQKEGSAILADDVTPAESAAA